MVGECYLISINNYAGGSATFVLDFTGTAVLLCSMVPIELTQFNVNDHLGLASLNWTTASETNNDYFIVERSTVMGAFDSIGVVKGAGTSSSLNEYSFIDETRNLGTIYYRLRQVDFDRNSEVSNIVSIRFSEESTPVTLEIFDVSGKLVHKEFAAYGDRRTIFEKLVFPNGFYAIRSIDPEGRVLGIEKLVKSSLGN